MVKCTEAIVHQRHKCRQRQCQRQQSQTDGEREADKKDLNLWYRSRYQTECHIDEEEKQQYRSDKPERQHEHMGCGIVEQSREAKRS